METNLQNISEIARLASASGYDMVTIVPMGPTTLVTCEMRMSTRKEPWVNEIDLPFEQVEASALEQLAAAGLDAKPTTSGIRAYGAQDNSWIDKIVHGKKRSPLETLGVATKFQPFSWRRPDYLEPKEDEAMPQDYWIPDL